MATPQQETRRDPDPVIDLAQTRRGAQPQDNRGNDIDLRSTAGGNWPPQHPTGVRHRALSEYGDRIFDIKRRL
ncbi:hypothetical protein ACOMHN_053861 [Nucella lapillus]